MKLLDQILLSESARDRWTRLAQARAMRLAGRYGLSARIEDEQARLNPDSSLTIFASVEGHELEMRIEPEEWSYTDRPGAAPAPQVDFGQLVAGLEERERELWLICYPRLYREAGRYGSPKAPAAGYATAVAWVRDGYREAPATARNIYLAACLARRFDFPMLFVAPELLAAISQTDAPASTDWREIKLPYPAGALMLPQGALRHPTDGAVDFIGWARIEAGSPLRFGDGYQAIALDHDAFIVWTGLRQAMSYPLLDTALNASTHPTIGGGQALTGVHTKPTREGVFELPLAAGEEEFLAQLRRIAFNTLLALEARPNLQSSPGRRVGTHTKGVKREIWEPTIIGRGYRIARERHAATGTHASPRVHWRRGHYRRQAFGPSRTERKMIWIEPTLVGIGEGN
jgi:hypothetical protein